jgi:adenylate kinase
MLNIVLFGPPGAGKGTQSEKIIGKYKLTHISTGDIFRKHLENGTELGKLAQKYMDDGKLVPDEVVVKMVDEKISNDFNSSGYIFDGYPRTVSQAEALDQLMERHNTKISGMISLQVPEEELIQRIMLRGKSSGRTDDQSREKIHTRIEVYNAETLPVADYYDRKGILNNIAGLGEINDIFERIFKSIDSF